MSELDPLPPADGRSAGAAIAPLLEAAGVDTVFGIPGVHNVELYRGLHATGIRHVLARHEQGAGFMADGYARISGRPGTCFVISGPGLTNIATPLGQAYSDSIPMLVIGAVRANLDLGHQRGTLHEISNQRAVAAPLTGFCATARHAAEVPGLINQALASMSAGRPRPAFVEVTLDALSESMATPWQPGAAVPRPALDPDAVAAAARLLADAERPVMIVGGGAVEAAGPLRALVDSQAIAVIPSIAGKGVVPDDHVLSLGASLPQPATLEWLAQADVVLAVGTELATTDSWQPSLPLNGTLIRIDIDPRMLRADYPATVAIRADAGSAVAAIAQEAGVLPDVGARHARLATELCAVRERLAANVSEDEAVHQRVLAVMMDALPNEAAVFTDMTRIAYTGNERVAVAAPRSWFHPAGYGTLGYAVPAAIGACFAATGRPVMALVGDYGFGYTAPEVMVASEYKLPLPIVIWNSADLGAIDADMRRKNIPPIGVVAQNPDFERLAAAYGCGYARPGDLDAFSGALAAAFGAGAPTIIELTPAVAG